MMKFFWGWRRKVGVWTLVMACLAMVGWVRSFTINDNLIIHSGTLGSNLFASEIGSFVWYQAEKQDPDCSLLTYHRSQNHVAPVWNNLNFFVKRNHSEMVLVKSVLRFRSVAVWYGLIVIPLILLSAFLLLTKPSRSKSQSPLKPIPETVVNHA